MRQLSVYLIVTMLIGLAPHGVNAQSALAPTAEQPTLPGTKALSHEQFHAPYERMFRELNAGWIEKHLPNEETFTLLYEWRHLVNAINGDDSGELGAGDYGFMNQQGGPMRDLYVKMYKNTKCHCNYGSCRPTTVRLVKPGEVSESGYMVFVNEKWEPVGQDVLHHENAISADLWFELMSPLQNITTEDGRPLNGHICKLMSGTTECVLTPEQHG